MRVTKVDHLPGSSHSEFPSWYAIPKTIYGRVHWEKTTHSCPYPGYYTGSISVPLASCQSNRELGNMPWLDINQSLRCLNNKIKTPTWFMLKFTVFGLQKIYRSHISEIGVSSWSSAVTFLSMSDLGTTIKLKPPAKCRPTRDRPRI